MVKRPVEELYRVIGRVLSASAPAGWQKVWVNASIGNDTGETKYDYIGSNGGQNWFEPPVREQYEVYTAFKEMRQQMIEAGQQAWHGVRFELTPDGKFSIDYRYDGPTKSAAH